MAQRLERAADNRVLTGSNPTEAVWKLFAIPFTPTCSSHLFPDTQLGLRQHVVANRVGFPA